MTLTEREERIIADAHRWSVVRDMLIAADCPIEDGCHIPSVVRKWLDGVQSLRRFSALGSIDPLDMANQLDTAAKAGDSSLCEVAALVIRRLLKQTEPAHDHGR